MSATRARSSAGSQPGDDAKLSNGVVDSVAKLDVVLVRMTEHEAVAQRVHSVKVRDEPAERLRQVVRAPEVPVLVSFPHERVDAKQSEAEEDQCHSGDRHEADAWPSHVAPSSRLPAPGTLEK